ESDGFTVLHARPGATLPSFRVAATAPADGTLVAELRAWPTQSAPQDSGAAYVVRHDATLQELATRRPGSEAELAGVKGLGPAKLARHGVELARGLRCKTR